MRDTHAPPDRTCTTDRGPSGGSVRAVAFFRLRAVLKGLWIVGK